MNVPFTALFTVYMMNIIRYSLSRRSDFIENSILGRNLFHSVTLLTEKEGENTALLLSCRDLNDIYRRERYEKGRNRRKGRKIKERKG